MSKVAKIQVISCSLCPFIEFDYNFTYGLCKKLDRSVLADIIDNECPLEEETEKE